MLSGECMEIALYNSATSLASLQRWQEATTHNIAASSVPGFKGNQMSFQAIHSGMMGANTAGGKIDLDNTMAIAQSTPNFSEGVLKQTGAPTHVAIRGEGFFKIRGEDFDYYTRDGEFHVDAENRIVNKHGHPVLGDGGPLEVTLENGPIQISPIGEITQGINAVGKLSIFDVHDKTALSRIEGGFMLDPNGQTNETLLENPKIVQGSLEESNVSAMTEMVNLITISRAFELNNKVIQNLDQLTGKTIEVLGGTG